VLVKIFNDFVIIITILVFMILFKFAHSSNCHCGMDWKSDIDNVFVR
jgi:hypothetical protein